MSKTALIIGAGPAGLTVAHELLTRTDYQPIILEMSQEIGGISRTVNYKGNRMDIGGHRFFSKSDRVMNFWLDAMPIGDGTQDQVMLERSRLSRILFLRKFFDYPISLNGATLRNLGLARIWKIGWSYLAARLFRRHDTTLEDFYINRFGRELYETFFMAYTEKVWGVPCREIPAEWGAQRVKGLSVAKTLLHAAGSLFGKKKNAKHVETSLIDRFYYPKFGPGQLWECVRDKVVSLGGQVEMGSRVVGLTLENGRITAVQAQDEQGLHTYTTDIVYSTMPIRDLLAAMNDVPQPVRQVSDTLPYRDFMTVGLLLSKLKLTDPQRPGAIRDNWIYIQERDVEIGRMQLFHNWSPYMVAQPGTCFLGLEYFCYEGDRLWALQDDAFATLAIDELCKLGIIEKTDVLDWTVVRQPKAYPAYFGSYDRFPVVRQFLDSISNLVPLGRNGMHRYNNMDHSMLTAMVAVDNLLAGITDRENLWSVNAEQEYHEDKEHEVKK